MTLAAYSMRALPDQLSGLISLALDLRWTWHHGGDQLWRALDEEAWEATHNAWLVLNGVAVEHLQALSQNPDFLTLYQEQVSRHEEFTRAATWYSDSCNNKLDGETPGSAWNMVFPNPCLCTAAGLEYSLAISSKLPVTSVFR